MTSNFLQTRRKDKKKSRKVKWTERQIVEKFNRRNDEQLKRWKVGKTERLKRRKLKRRKVEKTKSQKDNHVKMTTNSKGLNVEKKETREVGKTDSWKDREKRK